MKSIILLIAILFWTVTFAQSITFELLGPMDKPLPVIEIQQQKNDSISSKWQKRKKETVYVFYMDLKSFDSIIKKINSMNTKVEFEKKIKYEHGSYRIKYDKINNNYKEYVLNSYRESVLFFSEILKLTNTNNDLSEELRVLINRLNIHD